MKYEPCCKEVPVITKRGHVLPNYQVPGQPTRTVLAVWSLILTSGRERQYAYWSDGSLITRLAEGPRRFGNWSERKQYRPSLRKLKQVNSLLKNHGYLRDYLAPRDQLIGNR